MDACSAYEANMALDPAKSIARVGVTILEDGPTAWLGSQGIFSISESKRQEYPLLRRAYQACSSIARALRTFKYK